MYYCFIEFLFGDLQLVESMLIAMYQVILCKEVSVIAGLHEIVQEYGPLEEFKNLHLQISSMSRTDYTDLGHQTLLYR